MKTIVIIPAYNEEKMITEVIESIKGYVDEIIVVDDGSSDRTAELARKAGAVIYSHLFNCGLGVVLNTGIKAALARGAEIVITFDADGQHEALDLPSLVEPILKNEAEVVIGSRFLTKEKGKNLPWRRLIYNKVANLITFILFGLWVSDSQSGLRALGRQAFLNLELRSNRMEVSSEIIREIKKHHWRYKEIPIKPIYTSYSLSKGQSFKVGIKTFWRLLLRTLS